MKITKREFKNSLYKYLKPGKFTLTNHGKDEFVVTIENVATNDTPNVAIIKTAQDAKEAIRPFIPNSERMTGTYGCGCKKTESLFCTKHDRQ